MSVLRSVTGTRAEKAKVCWENPVQGTQQISGVSSVQTMPVASQGAAGHSDKEGTTV
jgi:hypothetical protein